MDQKKALKQLRELKRLGKSMRLAGSGWQNDWQLLISIILSARTRDEVTIEVCEKMFKKYPNPKEFSKLNLSKVKKLIGSINFYNNKSKMIFETTKKIIKEFEGDVPKKIEELTTLPGVGRKTANVFLAEKGNDAIGVDTHVKYISNYLEWVKSDDPKLIEEKLKKLFPKKKWREVNTLLVTFGKTYTSKKEKDNLLGNIKNIN